MSDLTTPCCGAELIIITKSEGPSYMQSDVPDEILCAGDGCYNAWNAKGKADEWNK